MIGRISPFVRAQTASEPHRTTRRASTDVSVGGVIQSNNNNESGFTLYNVTLNHNAGFNDYTYHVEVLMNRSSSLITTPVFVGLDWQPPPT